MDTIRLSQAELPGFDAAREARLADREADAHAAVDEAIGLCAGKNIKGIALLFSGGDDSTTLFHMFRPRATMAIHANTTIGIEETRQFVRDYCGGMEMPLYERYPRPGYTYEDMVLGAPMLTRPGVPVLNGFPGPMAHSRTYLFLKEHAVRAVRDEVAPGRDDRLILLGGIRRSESDRRKDRPRIMVDGRLIWVSPFIDWTKLDLMTYRRKHRVKANEVAALIHMSGECLCGAYAKPGELEMIGDHFPVWRNGILKLQKGARNRGMRYCEWGWGAYKERRMPTGPMCGACEMRLDGQLF